MALKNPKHELFAQYRSEGKTADEAYVLAGYKANRGNAARLNANEGVLLRVRALTDRRARMADVTVEALTKRYNDAIDKADTRGSDAAIMAGLNNLAKLHGLIIDKARVEQGRLDGMSDDAIADDIESRLARIAEGRVEGAGEAGSGTGEKAEPKPDRELLSVPEAVPIPQEGQDA